jgi:hypothetical protein
MDKLAFENPLLKYKVCFNIRDNEKQENIGTVFCKAWLPGLRETSLSVLNSAWTRLFHHSLLAETG